MSIEATVIPVLKASAICSALSGVVTTNPIDTTGASLLVAAVNCWYGAEEAPTDSEGNIFIPLYTSTGLSIYYALDPKTNAKHTFSLVNAGSEYKMSISASAFSGVAELDVWSAQNGGKPGSISPTADGDLVLTVLGGFASPGGSPDPTVDSGFTSINHALYVALAVQSQVQATAKPLDPTWKWNDNGYGFQTVVVAFKATAADGGVVVAPPVDTVPPVTGKVTRTVAGVPMGFGDMYWNSPIDRLPLDSRNDAIMAALAPGRLGPSPEFALNIVTNATPVPKWQFGQMNGDLDSGNYPLTPTSQVSAYRFGQTTDVAKGPYTGEDSHVISLNTDTATLYETYLLQNNTEPYSAATGTIIDLLDYRLRSAYKQAGDSAGLDNGTAGGIPIWPMILTHDEVFGGKPILHMCRFALAQADAAGGFEWPATHSAGGKLDYGIRLGSMLRLRDDFDMVTCRANDLNGQLWPDWFIFVLQALKTYGVCLTDFGSRGLVSTDNSQGWGDTSLPSSDNWKLASCLHGVLLSDLRLVDNAPRIISRTSGQVNPNFVSR